MALRADSHAYRTKRLDDGRSSKERLTTNVTVGGIWWRIGGNDSTFQLLDRQGGIGSLRDRMMRAREGEVVDQVEDGVKMGAYNDGRGGP